MEPGHKQKAPSLNFFPVAEVNHLPQGVEDTAVSGLRNEACARDPVHEALVVEGEESEGREEMNRENEAEQLHTLVVEDMEEAVEISGTELQSGVTESMSSRGSDADDSRTSNTDLPYHHEVVESRTHTAAGNGGDVVTASLELLKDKFEHADPVLEVGSQKPAQEEEVCIFLASVDFSFV